MYLVLQGIYAASLFHMLEMIVSTYGMGYLQVLALHNFDEAEKFAGKEFFCTIFCSALYTGISFWGGWFDRKPVVTVLFACYCVLLYFCAYLANRAKRSIDTEQLNVMLQEYQGSVK